ncbi:hypothetical protein [Fructilactobacillus fructivorans]|uniref:Uncharacterized protein n=1 Tax=Fructilactobacillus fructivorans TaxID=1614 RepID=A0AAE6P0K3_9LACO|nr:hypothetical protein [Fructilactobacillus fructivorans]KRK58138.1 hypothetical protein FC73_GL000518 [Fructilactobacillus fructivorans]KRN13030.1 hypothetical protein IV37_GL000665 [Fructilactobacillus fructivorans]KRN41370.1 hypothetical protein IV51_GL000696 [Fructilactobacillus fructivorans]KRN42829.1 hypothetical protein IV48_GL001051 [Fructilactobacillus fructivorans]QFX92137.1 hypothetical protein LF543_00420 [Fructilactobacillus fructivorans]
MLKKLVKKHQFKTLSLEFVAYAFVILDLLYYDAFHLAAEIGLIFIFMAVPMAFFEKNGWGRQWSWLAASTLICGVAASVMDRPYFVIAVLFFTAVYAFMIYHPIRLYPKFWMMLIYWMIFILGYNVITWIGQKINIVTESHSQPLSSNLEIIGITLVTMILLTVLGYFLMHKQLEPLLIKNSVLFWINVVLNALLVIQSVIVVFWLKFGPVNLHFGPHSIMGGFMMVGGGLIALIIYVELIFIIVNSAWASHTMGKWQVVTSFVYLDLVMVFIMLLLGNSLV